MSNWDKERLLRSSILAGLLAVGLAAAPAMAQEAEEDEDEQQEEQQESQVQAQDRITVTGSLIRRDEFSSAAPIQVITAETATLEGLLDTSEILQDSSIAAGSTQINTQFGGFIVNGGPGVNSVSLRGLGAQRTLLLFNGRRFGPSGVEGRVGAVDLNTIPQSIVQRIEILKDGASSIYGSDAVAGVINVITRTEIDDPVLSVRASMPFEGGGESYTIDGATGWSFDRGFITLSAAYNRQERLTRGDRDYFGCPSDYVFDPVTGARVDRIERNPTTEGQGEFKCFNSGVVNAIDVFNNTTRRFIIDPSAPAGQAAAGFYPGFRLRAGTGLGNQLGIEETDTNDPRLLEEDILPLVERTSIYLTGEYDFGFATGFAELLYNNRTTEQHRNRQFFPWSTASRNAFVNSAPLPANCLDTATGLYNASCGGAAAFTRPIALIPFNTEVDIDYWYGVVGLRGDFGANAGILSDWTWETSLSHSLSDGSYSRTTVDVRNVVDALEARSTLSYVRNPATGDIECRNFTGEGECLVINYFSQDFLAGNLSDAERAFLFPTDTGNTEFTQTTFTGFMTGELFDLPAGAVGMALGVEARQSEIDDQPGPLSFNNQQWGLTSAVNTAGEDEVFEAFAELEVPIVAGKPFFEELTLSASGRVFDYELYDTDSVYKLGLNWQINPLLRLRATEGMSFRAPGLFELYLGNQTGFAGQGIDPCIDWGENTNPLVRTNCAAEGIPADYAGIGSSALVISGGGAGFLTPETSEASTFGLILTPTLINLSIALDYFEVQVDNQVSQLGAGSILGGCYGGTVFPNSFCDLFVRNTDPTSPGFLNIVSVNNNFVNINQQRTEGLDLTARYEHEFDFGELTIDFQGTWTFEDSVDLFQGLDGFETNDFNGSLGDPDFVAQANAQFRRGDWTYSWFTDFVSRMSNDELFGGNIFDFNGADTFFKQYSEAYFQHGASVRYRGADWTVVAGVTNIFDEHPAGVSTGTDNRLGVTSLSATQFDLRGRSGFVSLSKSF